MNARKFSKQLPCRFGLIGLSSSDSGFDQEPLIKMTSHECSLSESLSFKNGLLGNFNR